MARKKNVLTPAALARIDAKNRKRAAEMAARDTPHAKKRYTVAEVQAHMEFIEGLLNLGTTHHQIAILANRPPAQNGLGIPKSRAKTLIARVNQRQIEEDQDRRATSRGQQVRRLKRYIQNCQGQRDPNRRDRWLVQPNYKALGIFEKQLAKIEGNEAPTVVDVNVQHVEVMVATFRGYPLGYLEKLHARAQEKRRLAQAYLAEHPEEKAVIDVEGVAT